MKQIKLATLVVALIAVVSWLAPSVEAGAPRLVIDMHEPFEIDGQMFDAGRLSVRHVRAYGPTSSLTEVCAGSRCVGLLQAERVADEIVVEDEAMLTFERSARGHLVLVGYSSPRHDVHGEFRFRAPATAVDQHIAMTR